MWDESRVDHRNMPVSKLKSTPESSVRSCKIGSSFPGIFVPVYPWHLYAGIVTM